MAPRPPRKDGRPSAKTPAERAEEAADHQSRLKREAAERRKEAEQRAGGKPSDVPAGRGRPRTP